ncbi:chemotaxis protein CheW [Deferrisoma palaeochoriense]
MAKIGEIRKKKAPGSTGTEKPGTRAGKGAGPKPPEAGAEPGPPAEAPAKPQGGGGGPSEPPPAAEPAPGARSTGGEPFEALVFRVGENRYALRLADVDRVEMAEHVTRVPRTPPYVLGVATVRGEPVPAVDFRRLFGLPPREWDLATRLLVLRVGGRRVGLVVDEARRVVRLRPEEVVPPPDMIHGLAGDYLVGIVRRGEEALLLLDLTELLALADRGGRPAAPAEEGGTHG